MIKNERQLKITKKKLREFDVLVSDLKAESNGTKDLRLKMQIDALNSDISLMRQEVNDFEELKSGKVRTIIAKTFHELPEIIIKARIARSMTHKDLAMALKVNEQQIQRYENNNYASVSFSKLEKIVEILDIAMEETATLVQKK